MIQTKRHMLQGEEKWSTDEQFFVNLNKHWLFNKGGSVQKYISAVQETQVPSLGREDPLEKEMATHSTILAWEIPRTEEHGGLQSMGSYKSCTGLSY